VVARLLTLATGQVIAGVVNQLKGYMVALNIKAINVKAFPKEAIERRMDSHKV
jgi:hypothetical protein